jgi:hypothetical protein
MWDIGHKKIEIEINDTYSFGVCSNCYYYYCGYGFGLVTLLLTYYDVDGIYIT